MVKVPRLEDDWQGTGYEQHAKQVADKMAFVLLGSMRRGRVTTNTRDRPCGQTLLALVSSPAQAVDIDLLELTGFLHVAAANDEEAFRRRNPEINIAGIPV
jgi:hypothetical protein